MKLAHLSDIHFGAEDPAAINAARRYIQNNRPDAIIVSGDVSQRGKRMEFLAAAQWLSEFEAPVICAPGNHDVPLLNALSRAYRPFARFKRYLGQYWRPLNVGGVKISAMNTARGWQMRANWAEGAVNMKALEETILKDPVPDIVVCHHPFQSLPEAPLRTRTVKGESATKRLAASGVKLLLTGHVHAPSATLRKTELGSFLAVSSGTLSKRLRDVPPSFNWIHWDQERVQIDVLSCADDEAIKLTSRAWTLPDLYELQNENRDDFHERS